MDDNLRRYQTRQIIPRVQPSSLLICRGVPPWAPFLSDRSQEWGAHGTPLQIRTLVTGRRDEVFSMSWTPDGRVIYVSLITGHANTALWLLRRGETFDSALYPIALAIRLHRVHRVVIGCATLEAVHPDAENGKGMAWVQPDWRFRRLFQFRAIRAVADDTIMHR